jgi:RimJ/RimL family protein N-acetyltransferase
MLQLQPDDYSLLERFFGEPVPNDPMLRAFLQQRVPGQAYVDSLPDPGACVVAVNYRFVFFGGKPSRAFQENAIARLRAHQALDVVWPAGSVRLPHGRLPEQVIERLEFRRRENRSRTHLDALAEARPETEVRKITSRTMGRCLWREDVLRATGSTSEFLGHGLGFCLAVEEEIVAEAYAVIWSGERAEIATVTNPVHRGQGYATVLCAALIKACESVGLSTYWNCDADNLASLKLAVRLGYDDLHPYRFSAAGGKPAKRARSTFGGFARRLFGGSQTRR